MDKLLNAERQRKRQVIIDLYDARNTQEYIANKLDIPISVVQKVLQMSNYEHTKKKTHENLSEGQKLNMCTLVDDWSFLDDYNF